MTLVTRMLLITVAILMANPAFAQDPAQPRVVAGFLGIGGVPVTQMPQHTGTAVNPPPAPPAQGHSGAPLLPANAEPRVIAGFFGLPFGPNPNDPADISDITALFSAVDNDPNLPADQKAQIKEQLIRLSTERRTHAVAVQTAEPPVPVQYQERLGVAGFMNESKSPEPIPPLPEPPAGFHGATTAR